jgi:hypothetical protein
VSKAKYTFIDALLLVAIVRASAFVLRACVFALRAVLHSSPLWFFLAAILDIGLTIILLPEIELMPESYVMPHNQAFSPPQAVGFCLVIVGSAIWVILAYVANRLSRLVWSRITGPAK